MSTVTPSRTAETTVTQLRELEADLLAGRPVREAVAAHRQKHGLTQKRAQRDLAQVRRKWSRDHSADYERGLSIARAERIYQRAVSAGNDEVALEAERLRAELLGLLNPVAENTKKNTGAACRD